MLFFQKSDSACKMMDLVGAVLRGTFYAEGGAVDPIYKKFSEGRMKDGKLTIDIYLWLDSWKTVPQRIKSYCWEDSKHFERVCELLHKDPKNQTHIP